MRERRLAAAATCLREQRRDGGSSSRAARKRPAVAVVRRTAPRPALAGEKEKSARCGVSFTAAICQRSQGIVCGRVVALLGRGLKHRASGISNSRRAALAGTLNGDVLILLRSGLSTVDGDVSTSISVAEDTRAWPVTSQRRLAATARCKIARGQNTQERLKEINQPELASGAEYRASRHFALASRRSAWRAAPKS